MIPVKENYIVDKNGKTTNVVIAKKDYDRMLEYINELEDIAAYDRAKKEKGQTTSWNRIKR